MPTYIDSDAFRHTARCDCGWNGIRRWSRGSAELDAALHAVSPDHFVDTPCDLDRVPLMALTAS
ncbi:hypothetical protein AWC12_02730 [Mycolicibacterium iranicum]|uniref:Uncharacterized protein n=1 Tax=Mycolicibacterium iranicum TaxID=912594 RepID=A0A1X1X0U8_MYCIR|nr:hypothetical protein AWC12_02730 [Mycolicibacterium iranicum]